MKKILVATVVLLITAVAVFGSKARAFAVDARDICRYKSFDNCRKVDHYWGFPFPDNGIRNGSTTIQTDSARRLCITPNFTVGGPDSPKGVIVKIDVMDKSRNRVADSAGWFTGPAPIVLPNGTVIGEHRNGERFCFMGTGSQGLQTNRDYVLRYTVTYVGPAKFMFFSVVFEGTRIR